MLRKILISAVLLAGSASANAALLFSENFDDISTLGSAGWLAGNFGTGGATADTWFQGNTGIFDAQTGAADSYVASNYLSAGFGGNVDNWLVTPLIAALTGSVVTFSTRTAGGCAPDSVRTVCRNRRPSAGAAPRVPPPRHRMGERRCRSAPARPVLLQNPFS